MTYKFIPKTFDECYEELANYLSERGIGSDKVEGDTVYELAIAYSINEQLTAEEDSWKNVSRLRS